MIKSFACQDTQALFQGASPERFRSFQLLAERRLQMLDCAEDIAFFPAIAGNRVKQMATSSKSYCIKINYDWRICFTWRDADAYDVVIANYNQVYK